jgi:hypothetical protein
MAQWQAKARLTHPGVTGPADEATAVTAIRDQLTAAAKGWAVDEVNLRPAFALGEWVRAERSPGRTEFARIVQGLTELQVEFADGTRRALRSDTARV